MSTIRDITSLRQDFISALSSLGFVPEHSKPADATLNTNSANVAAQDVASVEGLACPDCIIETFEVDWRYSVSYRCSH